MNWLKNRKGSVTIEAAVILPIMMSLFLSLIFLMKIVYTHVTIQHAINDTANQIATYSYLYSASGLQSTHDNLKDNLGSKGEQAEEDMKYFSESWDAFLEASGNVSDNINNMSSTQDLKKTLTELSQSGRDAAENAKGIKELTLKIAKNPKQEVLSIGSLIGACLLEDGKNSIIQPVIGYMIGRNLENNEQDADALLKKLSVVGGMEGLDFSECSAFKDKKSIDIVVRYKCKIPVPVNIFPDIYLVQRSTVRAWLDGEGKGWSGEADKDDSSSIGSGDTGSSDSADKGSTNQTDEKDKADNDSEDEEKNEKKELTVWDLPPKQRGKILQNEQGRNLPSMFPVVTKIQNNTIYSVKSIDLTEPTYQKVSNVKYKVKSLVDELAAFTEGEYKNYKVGREDYNTKTLVLIVPKDSLNSLNKKALEECIRYAESLNINVSLIEHLQKKTEE